MTTDYSTMKKNGVAPAVGEADARRQWWRLEGLECAGAIQGTLQTLAKAQVVRRRQMVINDRLYGTMSNGNSTAYQRLRAATTAKDKVTYEAIREIGDTLKARIGETKPRPYFLTSGGDYREQRKAKRLNQFEEGNFYENKTYDVGIDAFGDGEVQGDGHVYVYPRAGRIRHERVMPGEIWVDEIEALYNKPRNLYRVKEVDREELLTYFEDDKDAVKAIKSATTVSALSRFAQTQSSSDMVTVSEAWHLGAENEDGEFVGGKHAIAINGAMLLAPEEYDFDFFPFARFQWCKRPQGYYGQGLCEQLAGLQMELNAELSLIQRSMRLAGVLNWMVPVGSKIVKAAFNNEIGNLLYYAGGQAPTPAIPEPIHQIFFQNTALIIERMRDIAGVSQMSTAGRKPVGLNSGVAIREVEDIESDRHRSISRQNDNLYLSIAELDVAIATKMAKDGKLKPVRVPGKTRFTSVDWKKDIGSVSRDAIVMQCFPVSRLPREPAGRLQTIQEYVQAGFLTPRQARHALDFPDIDSVESLQNAQEDILTETLDRIVDEGESRPPEPTDDLPMAKEMVVEYIQRYRSLGLEYEKLDMLRSWSAQVDMMQTRASMAPAPGATSSTGVPQGAAAPQPVSDMVPNVPGVAA